METALLFYGDMPATPGVMRQIVAGSGVTFDDGSNTLTINAPGGVGPAGPQGIQGIQGPAGPQGEAGTDGWTYAKLAADFTTSSGSAVDVTGLAFTPVANTQYDFKGTFYLRTPTTATVGPRPGLAWASGLTDGVARLDTPSSATAATIVMGNPNAALLAAVGGLPNTTQSYPGFLRGGCVAGANPSGTVRVQLASETAATNVTMKAGSWLAWRVIA